MSATDYLARNPSIPAFLSKLYRMVDEAKTNDLICWSERGDSFYVIHQEDFAKSVLPHFFKHNNFASFVRQLNMYGFHKVPHPQQGVLKADVDVERLEFNHPHFKRDRPDLLCFVMRKRAKGDEDKPQNVMDVQRIMKELTAIRNHQLMISTDLQNLQQNNQMLWEEAMAARERHNRHQSTIDKILRFLASVFSSQTQPKELSRKRPLLIEPQDIATPGDSVSPSKKAHVESNASGSAGITDFLWSPSSSQLATDARPPGTAGAASLSVASLASPVQATANWNSLGQPQLPPIPTMAPNLDIAATTAALPAPEALTSAALTPDLWSLINMPSTAAPTPLPTMPTAGANSTSPPASLSGIAAVSQGLTSPVSLLATTGPAQLTPLPFAGLDPSYLDQWLTPAALAATLAPTAASLPALTTTPTNDPVAPLSTTKSATQIYDSMDQLKSNLDLLSHSLGFAGDQVTENPNAGALVVPQDFPLNLEELHSPQNPLYPYLSDPQLREVLLGSLPDTAVADGPELPSYTKD
ncbi:Heat shock transcription factor [Dimargaris verticillata]|uniref:Heat shock transcription factor n=1 Tax=Dimargaris verticillata TaxID=2761393 RepID=A0A9W8B4H1_9FUNG|nr:Heat shock transcription factor [Dimargaris verticillata]